MLQSSLDFVLHNGTCLPSSLRVWVPGVLRVMQAPEYTAPNSWASETTALDLDMEGNFPPLTPRGEMHPRSKQNAMLECHTPREVRRSVSAHTAPGQAGHITSLSSMCFSSGRGCTHPISDASTTANFSSFSPLHLSGWKQHPFPLSPTGSKDVSALDQAR